MAQRHQHSSGYYTIRLLCIAVLPGLILFLQQIGKSYTLAGLAVVGLTLLKIALDLLSLPHLTSKHPKSLTPTPLHPSRTLSSRPLVVRTLSLPCYLCHTHVSRLIPYPLAHGKQALLCSQCHRLGLARP